MGRGEVAPARRSRAQAWVAETADGAWVSAPPTWIPLCRLYPPWLFADPDVVSLEAADRPNFFLHVTANGSLELAKWQAGDAFRHRASFSLHRGTWRAGLVALESLAEPGAFLYVSGPVLALRLYQHTEAFRRGTLFRLLGGCLPCLTLPALSPPHPSHRP